MSDPVSVEAILAVGAAAIAAISGYAELKIGHRDTMKQLAQVRVELDALKQGTISVALLEQAVANLNQVGTDLSHTMTEVSHALVRIQTQLELEGRKPPQDPVIRRR